MGQLTLFDDEDHFTDASRMVPSPAELEAIRQYEQEQTLARLGPEDRQRFYARLADEARRQARESRSS